MSDTAPNRQAPEWRGQVAARLRPYHCHLTLPHLRRYGRGRVFIETGTYRGDGVLLALDFGFEVIHSIEWDRKLYEDARRYFAGIPQVRLWHGNSAECLPDVLVGIREPITFWLDAHPCGPPSGEAPGVPSPLLQELHTIRGHPVRDHTIFIDDRRLLGTLEWDYLQEDIVREALSAINPRFRIRYLRGFQPRDIICASPSRPGRGVVGLLARIQRLGRRPYARS